MTSSWAWEEPIESTDFQARWDSRTEGFLSLGGSSYGSGAPISTYNWLDITNGPDGKLLHLFINPF